MKAGQALLRKRPDRAPALRWYTGRETSLTENSVQEKEAFYGGPRRGGDVNLRLGSKRRVRKPVAVAAMILASFAGSHAALTAETRQEQGKRLVLESLKVLGGDAFLNVRNLTLEGRAYSFYRQNLSGLAVFTRYENYEPMQADAPADWLPISRRDVYTEEGDYYALYPNGQGWEVTFRGARPLPQERIEQYRDSMRRNYFYFLRYRLDEPDLYFYYKGTEIVNNVPTETVEISDHDGESFTIYLRMSDRLPLQQVYLRRDPKTRIPYEEKSIWSKYRKVDGVTIPWNIRQERDGEKVFEFYGRAAAVNQDLDAALFQLGKDVPKLDPLP